MRVITQNEQAPEVTASVAAESYLETPLTHKSYHEMSDVPVLETDALARLHTNLEMLSDLTGRLSFVMKEVRYLLKA